MRTRSKNMQKVLSARKNASGVERGMLALSMLAKRGNHARNAKRAKKSNNVKRDKT